MGKMIETRHVDLLLQALADKTGQSRDHYGYGVMSEKIESAAITKKYLYESLQKRMEKAIKNGEKSVSLMLNKLDEIAKHLGHDSFDKLIWQLENPADPLLLSCVGNYYSYVRRSVATGAVYRSPVQITEDSGRVWLELKGPDRTFRGELKSGHGCIFCLMAAEDGKHFYHVYRIAAKKKPQVLQGVFSGILTAQEPVAGRAVLIRKDEKIEDMRHQEMTIEELKSSGDKEKQHLAVYFEDFSKNNLQINKSITFRIEDLVV